MIERIRELDSDQISRLRQLGHDALAAISPPIASMVYSNNPDQITALNNLGPDTLGAMSPQLADMLYGPDAENQDQGLGDAAGNLDSKLGQPAGNLDSRLGRYPGQPPIILPPFPQPPDIPSPPGEGDDDGGGDGWKPGQDDIVSWESWIDNRTCAACIANTFASPRPYGTPFPSGDVEPPAHERCRCFLSSSMRGSCPIHGYGSGRRIFELSSRY